MKTSKAIRIKCSPLYTTQLKRLREAVSEKDVKFHRQLLKAIEREEENLKKDMHHGTQIEKSKIPREYIIQYGVTNLWKIDLPGYWRMIYTIVGNEFEIISVLLEFVDHDEYDRKFGYRKK